MLSHFSFGISSTQEKHSCCDISINDCQCSECVDLRLDVLVMEDICITESHLLSSACFHFLACSSSFRLDVVLFQALFVPF